MEHSQDIKDIAEALRLFHLKVESIKKDAKNPFFKSNYATLSALQEATAKPLSEVGLIISQMPEADGLTTILVHTETGQYFKSTMTIKMAKDNDPQAQGSGITYARRYAYQAILNLNIEDDDDANLASGKKIEWMDEKTFQSAMKLTDINRLQAGIDKYSTDTCKMKKDYAESLQKRLNELKQMELAHAFNTK